MTPDGGDGGGELEALRATLEAVRIALACEWKAREQAECDRDRAEQAYAQLHASHRALLVARDDNNTRIIELRDERDRLLAERDRLLPLHAVCFLCNQPCNVVAGDPGLWPVHLGNDRNAHVACVRSRVGLDISPTKC